MRTTRRKFLTFAGGTAAGLVLAPRLPRLGALPASAQAIPGAPAFTGNVSTTSLGPVSLNAGVTVVRAQFNGTTNFSASMILPQPGTRPSDAAPATGGFFALFNQIGAFKGAAAALVGVPGSYYFQIGSTGAFQLSVEQPLPESVTPAQQTSFTGKGPDVTPYFTLPAGISQISMQTSSKFLVATLYHLDDLGGSPLVAGVQGHDGSIFDFRDPSNQPVVPITLADGGPYVFAVTNDINSQSTWSVSFA